MPRPFLLARAPSSRALFALWRPRPPSEAEKDAAQDRRLFDGVREAHAVRATAQEALARHKTRPYGCGVEPSVIEPPVNEGETE